ncbi:ATP-binding protein [Yinghuangia sp. YIM S09857]|uniref:ATP-binding protein n=1 Tax=Yinghuangia sp. YIM S09857 TaxID=3436929 RepID=UPI003F532F1B
MNLPCSSAAADGHARTTTAARAPDATHTPEGTTPELTEPAIAAPEGRLLAELRVPADGSLASDVRAFVRDRLGRLGATDGVLDDAVLLATELFTNALRYAPGTRIGVRFLHDPRARTCTVLVDDTSHLPPRPGDRHAAAHESGRGLAVVAALAHSWGWHPSVDGKSVWFSLRLHRVRHSGLEHPGLEHPGPENPGPEGATPCAKTSRSRATAPPCGAGSTSRKAPPRSRQSS